MSNLLIWADKLDQRVWIALLKLSWVHHLPGNSSSDRLARIVSLMSVIILSSDPYSIILGGLLTVLLLKVFVLLQQFLLHRSTPIFQIFWLEVSLRLKRESLTILLLNYNFWFDFEILRRWAPKILRESQPLPSVQRYFSRQRLLKVVLLMYHLRPWTKPLMLNPNLDCLKVRIERPPNLRS